MFQNLDRVQLYDLNFNLLADTDTLDLAQDIFVLNENVQETSIDKSDDNLNITQDINNNKSTSFNTSDYIEKYKDQKNINDKLVISKTINNDFYVISINAVYIDENHEGYIAVSEIANDILLAVEERKNFILTK